MVSTSIHIGEKGSQKKVSDPEWDGSRMDRKTAPTPRRPVLASRTPAAVSASPQDPLLAEPKLRLTFLYGPGFPESARPQLPHAPTKPTCSRGHLPRPRYTKARCIPARYPSDRSPTERREGQGASSKIQTARIEKRLCFYFPLAPSGGGRGINSKQRWS